MPSADQGFFEGFGGPARDCNVAPVGGATLGANFRSVGLYQPLFRALSGSGGRYVVVGGLATVLHGHARLTADVDLIVDFSAEALNRILDALTSLGLRPRPPVDMHEFADPNRRMEWIRDKGMAVFSLWDPKNPMLEVDLFVEHPIDFEHLWERSVEVDIGEATLVRIASIPDLIQLKHLAGRAQDLQDIEALERIAEFSNDQK